MEHEWTTSSLDLALSLDSRDGRRSGLERALREAIADGRVAVGARLPSTRALARDLGLARGTVIEAYSQLTAEGYLRARHGSGTVVSARPQAPLESIHRSPELTPQFDLRPGRPDLTLFPRTAWLAATRRVLQTTEYQVFTAADSRVYAGRVELRRSLAAYLGRARGVRTTPDRVVVCAGYTHALPLLCTALRANGITAAYAEDPSMPMSRTLAGANGLEVLPLAVDELGACVANLPNQRVAVIVTPGHQFPLGVTMHPERRAGLARWAQATGSIVIEDDYDGEFRFDRQPTGALQGLAPEHVVYCGTASKTLAPGLRLGWMALPGWLTGPVLRAKRNSGLNGGTLDQLTLAEFIDSGAYDRHVRRARLVYRRRRDHLVRVIESRLPSLRPTGIAAGLHAVLPIPESGPEEAEVIERAAEHSLAVGSLGPCWQAEIRQKALIVGYAAPPDHAFTGAVATLADVLSSFGIC